MGLQFLRKARVTFGKYGEEGKQINNLRISFNISKTKTKDVNTADVIVYNLNQDSIALLNDDNVFCKLEVKWELDEQWFLICSGDVLEVSTVKQGADIVTTISLGDGFKDLRDSTINKSYPEGTSTKNVVKDLIGSFGNIDGREFVDGIIDEAKTLLTGGTFSGKSIDVLTEIIEPEGLTARINNNDIVIEEILETNETQGYLITSQSGLIGSPQRKSFTINKLERKGVSFSCLLNPRIDVGSIVKLESKYITGEYIVYNLNMSGDNYDGSWTSSIEGLER